MKQPQKTNENGMDSNRIESIIKIQTKCGFYKKFIAIIPLIAMLILASFTTVFSGITFAKDSADYSTNLIGHGTEESPYIISTRADLDFLAYAINLPFSNAVNDTFGYLRDKHFVLGADINMGGSNNPWTTPIGIGNNVGVTATSGANSFRGVFDGNGYTISNLYYNAPNTDAVNNFGLFGVVGSRDATATARINSTQAVIRNINMTGVSITVPVEAPKSSNIGALVGFADYNTYIHNVKISGTILASNAEHVGGIVGRSNGHTNIDSNSLRVIGSAVNVSGLNRVGGIVGMATATTLAQSYSTGAINVSSNGITSSIAECFAGGLIGYGDTQHSSENYARDYFISDCYSTGNITASATSGTPNMNVGGLVGRIYSSSRNANTYIINSWFGGNIFTTVNTATIRIGGILGFTDNGFAILRSCAVLSDNINQPAGGDVNKVVAKLTAGNNNPSGNYNNRVSKQISNATDLSNPFPGVQVDYDNDLNKEIEPALFNQAATWSDIGYNLTWMWKMTTLTVGTKGIVTAPTLRTFLDDDTGNGSEQSPFVITTEADLIKFRDVVNSGYSFAGQHIRLDKDITLTDTNWVPIGHSSVQPFEGYFDGNNKKITGLKINDRQADNSGLFGYVLGGNAIYETSSIKDLTLVNPEITVSGNYRYVGVLAGIITGVYVNIENITATNIKVKGGGTDIGGLIGHITGSTNKSRLRNIHVDGNVNGRERVGGIVGYVSYIAATNISFIGDVSREILSTTTSGSSFGGLFGQFLYSTLSNSFANGSVKDVDYEVVENNSTGSYVGGLFGNGDYNTVINSYHAGGSIEGKPRAINQYVYIGGLAGSTTTTTFINCFSAATKIISYAPEFDSPDNRSAMGYLVGVEIASSYLKNCARLASTELAPLKETYFNQSHITKVLPLEDFKKAATFSRATTNNGMGWDMTNTWYMNEFANKGFPSLRSKDQTDETNFKGNGSAALPYLIDSAASLRIFRDLVNNNENYRDAHFLLTNDIDLSGANWTPIGLSANNAFMGSFDGNGHTVSGLLIDKSGANRGLFGQTTDAIIKNLIIDKPIITWAGGSGTAAVIGTATGSLTIENVHVRGGDISNSGSYTGGIVGHISSATSRVRIHNTSNSATVNAQSAGAGGIVGYANATLQNRIVITNSYNEGTIRQSINAVASSLTLGGIVGQGSGIYIAQCYNAGNITNNYNTYIYHIGGLIGRVDSPSSTIRNSYNIGEISVSTSYDTHYGMGGLAGYIAAQRMIIENSYNAGPIRTLLNNTMTVGGIVGFIVNTTSSLNGTVSMGNIYTYQNLGSYAWFANASSENNLPKVPESKNNLYLDTLNVKAINQFPYGSYTAYRAFHDGDGTQSKTVSELKRWTTYDAIGWSDSIWEHSPLENDGLPYLKGMKPPESQSKENRTLYIRSLDDFIEFRDRVNTNKEHFADRKIVVETDLDLYQFPQWEPIGTSTFRFAGHIDFGGHTVTGIRINANVSYAGLFGVINSGARIENLIIDNPSIKATSYVGALAGFIERDAFINNVRVQGDENCVIEANRNSTHIGGLIGRIGGTGVSAAYEVEITNSSSVANVTGSTTTGNSTSIGGLIGSAQGLQDWTGNVSNFPTTIKIYDCFATGTVKVILSGSNLGGFIGQMNGGVDIQRCYASGNVTYGNTATSNVGGFVGNISERNNYITDAFAIGNVASRTASATGGFAAYISGANTTVSFTNVYARGTVHTEAVSDYMGGLIARTDIPSSQFKISGAAAINPSVSGPNGVNYIGRFGTSSDALNLPGSARYPNSSRLDSMLVGRIQTPTEFHDEYANALVNGVNVYSFTEYTKWATWQNKGFDSSVWQIDSEINEGLPTLRSVSFEPKNTPGSPLNPIMINNYDELVNFRSRVNAGETFYGLTVKLGDDIDLTNRPSWIPIGQNSSRYFAGTFDGDGKFIRGLHVEEASGYFGFFGYTKGAIIKNIGFIGSEISTKNQYAGIVVGYSLSQLTLENVFAVNGSIHSTNNYVAGLVARADQTQNLIIKCYVDNVSIRGKNYVGGLVAQSPSIKIERSYFDAQIVAGVGAVSTEFIYAGGIIAHANEVAGLEQIQLQNISVQGSIYSNGVHHSILGGIVGFGTSNKGIIVRNAFVNSKISAITTSSNGLAVASGFVGWTNVAYGMRVYNSVIAGGTLEASAPVNQPNYKTIQSYFGTSDRGTGLYGENNRFNGEVIQLLSEGLGHGTYLEQLGVGGKEDIVFASSYSFKSKSTYQEINWNFDTVWHYDDTVNDSLPYLRGMAAVVELLDVIIKDAEKYRAADYNTKTFTTLQAEINWAKAYLASVGDSVTREALFKVISQVRSAVAGLRAENQALISLVEYIDENLVPVKDQFISFAQVDVLLRDSKIMIIRTSTLTGNNIIKNNNVQQMTAALNNAVSALQIDRSIINSLLASAQIKNELQFTAESWQVFVDALASALIINSQTNPSIAAITTAKATLEAAMNSLVFDTVSLEILIDSAKEITRGSITTAVWNALQNAITLAEEAVGNSADPMIKLDDRAADLSIAESTLLIAVGNAMGISEDLAAIRAEIATLIGQAQMLIATDYDAQTWNALQSAIIKANQVFANFDSTEEEYIEARDALVLAKAGLTMNLQPLRQAISNAKNIIAAGLVPGKTNEYFYSTTNGEVTALQAEINQAEQALASHQELTLQEMQEKIRALQEAVNALRVQNIPLLTYIIELKNTLGYNTDWTVPLGGTNRIYYSEESYDNLESQVRATESRIDTLLTADQLSAEYQLLMLARNNMSVNKSALGEAIDNSKKVEEAFVKTASWTIFKVELDNALNTYLSLSASFEDVRAATINLNAAFNAIEADSSIVSALIVDWSDTSIYVVANFKEDTFNAFINARSVADAASKNATIAVLSLQAAYYQMISAHSSLLPDKTVLADEILVAKDFSAAEYNTASFAALTSAINAAQAVNQNAGATYQEVKLARENLNDAVQNLILNTDKLQSLVDIVAGLTKDNFIESQWDAMMVEYANAVNFIALPPRTSDKDALETRYTALKGHIDGLQIDTTALEELIEQAENILEKRTRYTEQSISDLEYSLTIALTARDSSSSIEEITEAALDLQIKISMAVSIYEMQLVIGIIHVYKGEDEIGDGSGYAALLAQIEGAKSLEKNGTRTQIANYVNSLKAAIRNYLKKADYTESSWDVYIEALNDAFDDVALLPDVPPSLAFRNAIDGLIKTGELVSILEEIDNLNPSDYSNWSLIVEEIIDTDELLKTGSAVEIAEKVDSLKAVLLLLDLDISQLDSVLSEKGGETFEFYTENSFLTYREAVESAETFQNSPTNPAELAQIIDRLNSSFAGLVSIKVQGQTTLRNVIDTYQSIINAGQNDSSEGEYGTGWTLGTWNEFVAKFEAAKIAIISAENHTAVMSAYNNLITARQNLKENPISIDQGLLTQLQQLYDEWIVCQAGDYEEGFGALTMALNSAARVLGMPAGTTDADIIAAIDEINLAIEGLVEKEIVVIQLPNISGVAYDTETKFLSWDRINDAEAYRITINNVVQPDIIINSFNFGSFAFDDYVIEIIAIGNETTTLTSIQPTVFNLSLVDPNDAGKEKLDTPQNLRIIADVLTWTSVFNAQEYNIYIDDELKANTIYPSFDLAELMLLDGTYQIYIRALASDMIMSSRSEAISYTKADDGVVGEILDTPKDLYIIGSSLMWTAVDDAQGYMVFIDDVLMYVADSSTSADLSFLTEDGVYQIHVVAIAEGKEQSLPSESVQYTIQSGEVMTKLDTVTNIAITNLSTLVWDDVLDAQAYQIFIGGVLEATVFSASFDLLSITRLIAGNSYNITIRATASDFENSDISTPISYTVPFKLNTPINLTIDEDLKLLTWDLVDKAEGYYIYEGENLVAAGIVANSFSLAGYTAEGEYSFTVIARAVGFVESSKSAAIEYIVTNPVQLDAPLNVSIDNDTRVISWDMVLNAASYEIYFETEFVASTSQTNFDLSFFTADFGAGIYNFSVVAKAPKSIDSPASNASLTVSAQKLKTPSVRINGINLEWDAISNAEEYEITINDGTDDTVFMTANTYFSLAFLTENGTYTIQVVAKASGLESSNPSQAVTYTIGGDQLDAPMGLVVSDGILYWNAVDGAESYNIFINGMFDAVVTTRQFNLSDLQIAQTYLIKIQAIAPSRPSSEFSEIIEYVVFEEENQPVLEQLDAVENLIIADGVLSWDNVENAEAYQIFVDGMFFENTTETSLDLSVFTANGSYVLSIKAIAEGFKSSQLSAEITYTKTDGDTTREQLSKVTDIAVSASIITWAKQQNATGYQVFVDGELFDTVSQPACDLNSITVEGIYSVTIIAIADGYQPSEPSDVFTYEVYFTITEKLEVVVDIDINGWTLSWTETTGAESYTIYVDGVSKHQTDKTEFNLALLDLVDGEYKIAIRANATDKFSSDYSDAVTFVVNTSKLDTPADVDVTENILTWSAVTGATSYEISINGTIIVVYDTSYDLGLLQAGTYEISIKAKAVGRPDSDAALYQYIVETESALDAPSNAVIEDSVLSWEESENATEYQIIVDGEVVATVSELSFDLLSLDLEAGTYFVQIRAKSADAESSLTQPIEYIVEGENPIQKLDTPDGIVINNNILSWDAVDGAEYYTIFINQEIVATNITETSLNVLDFIDGDGDYTVLIKAHAQDKTDSESAKYDYRVQSITTKLNKPTNLIITLNILTWDIVEGADAYEIIVSDNVFAVVAGTAFNFLDLGIGQHKVAIRAIADSRPASDISGSITHTISQEIIDNSNDTSKEKLSSPQIKMIASTVVWSKVNSATLYLVYANNKLIGTADAQSFDLSTVVSKPGTYKIRVVATAEGKRDSDSSNEVSFEMQTVDSSKPPLETPKNINIQDKLLTWDAVEGAEGYQIYIDGKLFDTVDASTTSYDLKGIDKDKELDILVVAISSIRPSSDKNAASATIKYNPKDENSFIDWLKNNLIIIIIIIVCILILIILIVVIMSSGHKKKKRIAQSALDDAMELLSKAGELAIFSEANPSDAAAQAKTMAHLKETSEAIAKAEKLFGELNKKGK